jgi:hypothetical protein
MGGSSTGHDGTAVAGKRRDDVGVERALKETGAQLSVKPACDASLNSGVRQQLVVPATLWLRPGHDRRRKVRLDVSLP